MMTKELAKTLTTALVQFIDRERPEGTMCCSSAECEEIEFHIRNNHFDNVEAIIRKKLTRLTEFQSAVRVMITKALTTHIKDGNGREMSSTVFIDDDTAIHLAEGLLELAKNELLSYADESNPKIEAMADLERTFECNPEKLPQWLKNELAKKHLEGYIKGQEDAEKRYNESVAYHYDDDLGKKHLEGYIMGREDTMREMKDFIDSHFNTNKAKEGEDLTDLYRKEYAQPLCLRNGGVCTNPMRDCINCIPTLERFNTSSGTSSATLHGNTSITDGKEHNPSFTD